MNEGARLFVKTYRQNLGVDNAASAIDAYDLWLNSDDEALRLYLAL